MVNISHCTAQCKMFASRKFLSALHSTELLHNEQFSVHYRIEECLNISWLHLLLLLLHPLDRLSFPPTELEENIDAKTSLGNGAI